MSVSNLLVRIAFLMIPGVVGFGLYRKFTGRKPQKDWRELLEVLVFAIFSYAISALVYELVRSIDGAQSRPLALRAFFDETLGLPWCEIGFGCGVAVVLGALAAFEHKRKLVMRAGRRMGLTSRFGDEDVWELVFNSPDTEWAFVRDHKTDLVYYGFVHAWSDSGEARELLLAEVTVYGNSTGDEVYKTDVLNVSRAPEDLTLEFPVRAVRDLKGHGGRGGRKHEREGEASKAGRGKHERESETSGSEG